MHTHNHCAHVIMKYCSTCDLAYCESCGKEWQNNIYYTTPYITTTPIWTAPNPNWYTYTTSTTTTPGHKH